MITTIPGPDLAAFEHARDVVARVARRTPMESSRYLAELLGVPVYLKCENLQRTGSYKLRGAYHRISALSDEERARGVVAASAGNHAQGVAYAARELGIRATIFMPVGVALPKLDATRHYGADVVLQGDSIGETIEAAAAFAAETGAVIIPPFDHPDVIAGQGTLGLEILEQVPDATTIVVPIGGGGLAAGIASAAKQQAAREGRPLRIIGVQAENAAPYLAVARGGGAAPGAGRADDRRRHRRVPPRRAQLRDHPRHDRRGRHGLRGRHRARPARAARAREARRRARRRGRRRRDDDGRRAVRRSRSWPCSRAATSTRMLMQRVVAHGLAASDRYLTISVGLPDRPGQLARVAGLLAEANANVIEVLHTRHGSGMQISEVELRLSVETRGPEHREAVVEVLRRAGYDPKVEVD